MGLLKVKSVLAVIAACLHQSVIFSLFILSNLTIYVISYLKTTYPYLTQEHGYFLSPIAGLAMSSFCSLGGFIEHKIGPYL